jgi:hypothetical protein
MRTANSRTAATMKATVAAAVLATGLFATTTVQATPPEGCCGRAESAQICTLNQNWKGCEPGQGGNAECYSHSTSYPHCCDTDGWCG